jgi:beta-N-acetylhexosaminidase
MSESKAMILGCGGLTLTDDERAFYRTERPWGFILFGRNISEDSQIRDLVADLRDCIGVADAPVLIDQEGGRVQRIRPPIVAAYPPAAAIGALYTRDASAGLRASWLMSRLHACDLTRFGINVNCLPVLDVPVSGGHDVIGNRAYSTDPVAVSRLGQQAVDGLMAGGVLPVLKHMPGHGRAFVDSHKELPVVEASREDLSSSDFVPFMALLSVPMAMTAHIVFAGIDRDGPATTSRRMIEEVIRQQIGFEGLLMSDDTSMKALSGDFATKTGAIFDAGCDVILHCNGVLQEMVEVAANTPVLRGIAERRAQSVMSLFGGGEDCNEDALRHEFEDLVAEPISLSEN